MFKGLNDLEVVKSREEHGSNALTQIESETFLQKFLEGFKDPMLIILIAALVVQGIFLLLGRGHWYELAGIFAAILIANFVGVYSENQQEGKAQALKAEEMAKELAKVYRNGIMQEVSVNDLVVGDLVILQAGDKIPADGILLQGNIKVDQASLNGESAEATKMLQGENELGDIKDLLNLYYVFRGTVVTNGEAVMEIKEVGDKTIYGALALEMQEEQRDTPLKVKLSKLANQISMFGYIGASVIFVSYLVQKLVLNPPASFDLLTLSQIGLEALSLAVVIVVMAVPEGLPMMIALVLSMNMGKMMKDNVLVRKLNGIETAGGLNILFTDKTGTLTEGKLSVVEITTGNGHSFNDLSLVNEDLGMELIIGMGANNSATFSDEKVIGGNSTDRALMHFLTKDSHIDRMTKQDVREFNAFDSNKKCSSVTIMCTDGVCKTYVKGAAEVILERCKHYVDEKGITHQLTDKTELLSYMDVQASRSMRLLAVAVGPEDNDDLTLLGILSIRDNVRKEVVGAVREVQNAGVQVVMVTGDRKETAVAIGKETGLLVNETDLALTSSELAEKSDEELKALLPNLRVVARALPTDKSRLVKVAQELDLVVAMTGDGVNDAPALKKADVGFAMGSGTDVAKEAGDIIILDDNFVSIEKAILYGRTIFKSIRKFIIFQLTVNVAAVLLSFLAPLMGIAQPISIVSLLYINLVMDTLAALAFGGEPSLKSFMNEKPIKRSESIVTKYMGSQIFSVGLYIVIGSLFILLSDSLFNFYTNGVTFKEGTDLIQVREAAMLVFFMLTIVLNGFFARSESYNVFEHISVNKQFIFIMIAVIGLLVLLVQVLAPVASLVPLPLVTWLWMGVLALGSIPVDMIRKAIVKK